MSRHHYDAALSKSRREARLQAGLCPACGSCRPRKLHKPYKLCLIHLEANRAAVAKYFTTLRLHPEHPQ